MRKLLFSLLLSVLCVTHSYAYDVEIDGIYYNLVFEAKEAEVTRGDKLYTGTIVIPEIIVSNGVEYTVTSIGINAFYCCDGLTSVTIGNSVTSIGNFAFYGCSGLTSVTIPSSVKSIDENAFRSCRGLTSVIIPNSVKSIGKYAFMGCKGLTSITIPNSITSIGLAVFSGCTGLTSVTIPNSVTNIGDFAFEKCSNLTSIKIGSGIDCIYKETFANCTNLEKVYCSAEEVPYTKDDAFKDSYINYTTLYVPKKSIDSYKKAVPWKDFGTFKSIEDGDDTGDDTTPETKKCAKPSIAYENLKLYFSTATPQAEVISKINVVDSKKYYTNDIALYATYEITAYATRTGYEDSDVATAILIWADAVFGHSSTDVNVITENAKPLLITQDAGLVTISGLLDGEKVSAFDASGKQIATSRAIGAETIINLKSQQGKAAIIKVGGKSVKVMIK